MNKVNKQQKNKVLDDLLILKNGGPHSGSQNSFVNAFEIRL